MITLRELLDQLAAEGRLAPDVAERAPAALAAQGTAPWYIHALVAVGSWIAAVLFILFLGLAGVIEGSAAIMTMGLVLCVAGVGLRFAVGRVSWLLQVPLALSLAGELMFVVGVGLSDSSWAGDSVDRALLAAVGLELALIFAYRDPLHRFLSTWAIAGALLGLLLSNDLRLGAALLVAGLGWAVALIWERESALARHAALARPVAYGLVAGLLSGALALAADAAPLDWPASIGLGAALAYAAWFMTGGLGAQARAVTVAGALLLLIPAWATPGILAAALLLVVGFSRGNRILVGLGGIALAGFVGFYYYSLTITLLLKSIYLAGAGLLLLVARAAVERGAARAGLN